jgi:ribosomal protein S12 methylthiotransferase
MTVNTFDPSQTTTLDAPAKSLASQSLIASSKGNTIGFVSLGCPKNLVDSERILTQLRMEGYNIVPTYNDADMVIVNTCGFIDSAVQESLGAIGEALAENGKVLVTGCLGAKKSFRFIQMCWALLALTLMKRCCRKYMSTCHRTQLTTLLLIWCHRKVSS